ncbi:MAG: HAMP domain-containing protein [Oscillospiraceae bacterium]|jgi:signal transduction histidine kinase|nr:HAMP domain-containing protein [Oscillospiraceae bacterium]
MRPAIARPAKRRANLSVRWQIVFAFFVILASAFYFAASALTSLVGQYLLDNRAQADAAAATEAAAAIADTFARAGAESLYAIMMSENSARGSRLIALDQDARVQADTSAQINGVQGARLNTPEVLDVLNGAASSFGLHPSPDSATRERRTWLDFFRSLEYPHGWLGYTAAPILLYSVGENGPPARVGVLLCISSVQEVVSQLIAVQDQMLTYFVAAALAGLLLSILFSQIITKPLQGLAAGIERMARGDLASRVPVSGGREMAHLARAFNEMSQKLENLDDARNQFVSNASHELKTPLSTMKILIESMIYEPDMGSGVRQEFLTDINKEIDRLTRIIGDLLTLVRVDSGEVKLRREEFRLADVTRETARRLAPLLKERGQELTLSLADDIAVFADRSKISQVIYNLLENAVKYTPPHGKIRIQLTRDGNRALLEVADSGMGIPESEQPHIFERFYRVDKARSRSTGGTGLGLSIVRQVVQLHDGEITVTSQEGKGATFHVRMPMV